MTSYPFIIEMVNQNKITESFMWHVKSKRKSTIKLVFIFAKMVRKVRLRLRDLNVIVIL